LGKPKKPEYVVFSERLDPIYLIFEEDQKAPTVESANYEAVLAQSPSYNTTVYVGNLAPATHRKYAVT
jgi:hypothetical protein